MPSASNGELDEASGDGRGGTLSCAHAFHAECLGEWMRTCESKGWGEELPHLQAGYVTCACAAACSVRLSPTKGRDGVGGGRCAFGGKGVLERPCVWGADAP